MQGLWAHIIIRYQLCDELSVMWSHSPLSSCAPQQQQHRWRCVSLSFSSTVMQEWCFKTVFREKKSQTPHPLLSDRATLPSMRKNQHNSLHCTYLMKMKMMTIQLFLYPPLCLRFLPIGLYITTHFALLLLFVLTHIATICENFLTWTLFFY